MIARCTMCGRRDDSERRGARAAAGAAGKNKHIYLIAAALGLLTVNSASAAETFPTNLPTFACKIKPLTRDGLKTAKANRERFSQACLACIGDECAMRIWPAGFEDRETLCRNTFCLPKKVKRMTFSEGYNMSYRYSYRISADGETTILDGEYLEVYQLLLSRQNW